MKLKTFPLMVPATNITYGIVLRGFLVLIVFTLLFQKSVAGHEKEFFVRDLFYNNKHSSCCSGDLYLPHGSGPAPVVVLIHGGGWTAGDKSAPEIRFLSTRLAASGYAVFDVNYRLVQDGGTFPANISDVRDAVDFIYANSQKYNLDQDNIAVMGDSAGGYLALMLAFSADKKIFKDRRSDSTNRVRCAICYYPVTDLANLDKGFITQYMDDTEVHSPQLYKTAEPITYAATSVPTLLIHGTNDNIVPVQHSEKFISRLRRFNEDVHLMEIAKAGHGFRLGYESDTAFVESKKFLDEHLKSGKKISASPPHIFLCKK
ncbi:MAG: alpha/beta hydrolase [Candidatus Obscuribacterales bacterium]|nr:alpha/beta hydrolase [Candidatus Obscuribacterales bacterium]